MQINIKNNDVATFLVVFALGVVAGAFGYRSGYRSVEREPMARLQHRLEWHPEDVDDEGNLVWRFSAVRIDDGDSGIDRILSEWKSVINERAAKSPTATAAKWSCEQCEKELESLRRSRPLPGYWFHIKNQPSRD